MNFSFKSLIGNMIKTEVPVDPATFKDALALTTSWEPLRPGGSSFRTYQGVLVRSDRFEFRPTVFMKVFPWFFILIPLVSMVAYFWSLILREGGFFLKKEMIWILLFIFVFLAVGIFLIYLSRKAIIFDRNYGYFWKGARDKQGMVINPAEQKESVRLSEIHALQIVHEWISGNGKGSRPFKSYELNLVLNSGERVNVIDHGNRVKLLEDANQLAQFLSIPVWNASTGK